MDRPSARSAGLAKISSGVESRSYVQPPRFRSDRPPSPAAVGALAGLVVNCGVRRRSRKKDRKPKAGNYAGKFLLNVSPWGA